MSLGVSELRALAHPVRLRILSLLTGAAMTAADVSRELKMSHANASYHLRQLHAAGKIVPAGEERIRGGVAKRYRYLLPASCPPAQDEPMALTPAVYDAVAAELRRRARQVLPTPGCNLLTDAELWIDPEVWADIKARIQAASEDLHRAAQAPRADGTVLINATIAMFEMRPEPSA